MKKLFGLSAAALSLCAMPTLAAFSESSFNYGAMWEGIKDRSDRASLGLSHVAMYIGDANTQWSDRVNQPYNPYWEADMVKFCAQNDITPVFYAYVIAEWDKHLGYSDCDVGSPNHCTNGAETIRNDWQTILWRYGELAKGVASDMGSKKNTIPSIWLIEPDFYQYSVSGDNQRGGQQSGGGIPDAELAGTRFNQIVAAIKQHLPNAKIAVDISPWISNPQGWYSNFDASKIDYMFTSGGRTEGNNSKIRSENNMTWAQASGFLGKKIIADDGYGVGGGAEENYSDWQNVNNLKSRVADGVIGLTIKSPSASFMSWTKSNPISLGNSGSTQQPSSSSNRPSYSSSSSATNTGSGNSNSNLAIKPTRVGPVSQYGQLMAGNINGKNGRIYGTCEGIKQGAEVQVRGMSLYWSVDSKGTAFYTANAIDKMVKDMKIEIVRMAIGTDESCWSNDCAAGFAKDHDGQMKLIRPVVEAAIKNDIYVIIDWHSHTATAQTDKAKAFFKEMAETYGAYDNVIFEIFNEPTSQSWNDVKSYANTIVQTIRSAGSDNLILVGNPNWDQHPDYAVNNEVSDPGYNNVAYTFHYYAMSHGGSEWNNAVTAMNSGLSVFVSEWGTGTADGGGTPGTSQNSEWQIRVDSYKLSWANWSASRVSEGTAAFTSGSNDSYFDYTASGNMVKGYLASNPSSYAKCGDPAVKPNSSSSVMQSSSSTRPASSSSVALTTANLIDDFEDGDSTAYTGAKDTWFAFTDVGDKGASSIQNVKNATGYDVVYVADNGSKYMAGLKGITLNKGANAYDPYVTLGLDINGGLVGCKTITYKYKGAGHNLKAVTKGDEEGALSEYNYHKSAVDGSSSWQTASIPVSSLSQETGWGKSFALNASNIVKLQWEVKKTASANSLYVDDLACDGMNIVRPVSSSSVASSSSVESSSSTQSSSSSVSSSSTQSSSSVSSSSVASSSSVSLEWAGNAQLSNTSATGVEIGQSNGYSPDRVISKALEVTAGETNVLTFKMKLSGQGPLNISTNIESCNENTSVNTNDVNVTCSFTPASDVSTLTLTVPGGTWQTVIVSDLSVSVRGATVETVFNPETDNTTQEIVAGQAITPIVYHYENATGFSVSGLPKGLTAVLDQTAKTYTISGTVDAELGTHDYEYTVSVTGIDENKTATGVIKVTRAPLVTVFNPAAENTTQNVVAGQPIAPIVFTFENVSSISVAGLPKGLNAVLDEAAKTYTISGTVDAELGTHDYEYTVSVTGIDENKTATGVIKVTRAPLVTVFNPAAENTTQNVVAGQPIAPIVFNFENVASISVAGLPKGLNAVLNETAKTYTISGTVDAELGTHDYEYTVSVTGVDENTTATGVIKVTRAPLVTVFNPAAENTTQNVVAGQPIAPIVFTFENVSSISVAGLPKGLTAVLDQTAKTYTISGTVDAELGTHDYEYTVSVTGVDENTTATGVIKVTRAPLVTVFNPVAENTTQNVVAGQPIAPIVFNFENVSSISVAGLPKGLNAVLDETAKTYTISGTVDAELGTHDYEYTVSVTGVDENTTATGVIKVTRAPLVTVFNPTAENTTQDVVAGQPIAPIVFNFENVSSISVAGLPKGLTAILDETAKTYTISGTVDAELGTHDYEYTVSVTGVDENTTATGVIKVTRAPLVTVFNPAAENTTQNVVAGQPIAPIVFNFENVASISVAGLPKGLNAVLDETAKTYTISGTVDAELGTHDYEYTVSVTGVDENTTATGVIKVTRAPVVTTVALTSSNANQNIVAGEAVAPIVFSYENVTEVSVEGLPLGLNGSLDQLAGTYVISGSVDEKLSTHDYDYTVTFFGVDENKTATGTIKVTERETVSSSSSEEVVSSSSEAESSSSSEFEESSSSSQAESSSSSSEPASSSSSEAVESSSSEVVESSSSVVESSSSSSEVQSSSSSVESSSSSEEVVSSSSEAESSSSSSVEESSSSVEPESSSSSEFEGSSSSSLAESSSSSSEPASSSSSEVVESSSSEVVESSSSVVESSSSVEESSSSSEIVESSSSEDIESSSSEEEEYGPTSVFADSRPNLNISVAHNTLNISTAKSSKVKVQIFDLMGHAIASSVEYVSGNLSISLDYLSRGNYMVRVISGSAVKTARFAIK